MEAREHLVALVLVLVATSCGTSETVAVHAPFSDLTYDQALERARVDDRVVLLDFTASWCPPCKAMEKSTWPDADVQRWIGREAVAIQLDVDREFQRAAQMGVSGVPTIVFVSGEGRELGRFSGFRDPAGFLREAATYVPD